MITNGVQTTQVEQLDYLFSFLFFLLLCNHSSFGRGGLRQHKSVMNSFSDGLHLQASGVAHTVLKPEMKRLGRFSH